MPKYVRIEPLNGTIVADLESINDIEDDGDTDPSETDSFDADDFEQAAE